VSDRTPRQNPDLPDDRDLDDGGLDLTPRDTAVAAGRGGVRRWGAIAVLVGLVVAIGFVAYAARDAALFYRNADEAVAQRESLGTKRFRLQGVVVGKPVKATDEAPGRFTIEYNDVSVDIVNTGKEPALFKAGLPVVLEGHWNEAGTAYLSDRILVKHTEDYKEKDDGHYEEKHPERVDDEAGSDAS